MEPVLPQLKSISMSWFDYAYFVCLSIYKVSFKIFVLVYLKSISEKCTWKNLTIQVCVQRKWSLFSLTLTTQSWLVSVFGALNPNVQLLRVCSRRLVLVVVQDIWCRFFVVSLHFLNQKPYFLVIRNLRCVDLENSKCNFLVYTGSLKQSFLASCIRALRSHLAILLKRELYQSVTAV